MNTASSSHVFDIAVVGSGFGGSLLAAIAQRVGRSVVLIEKGKHPRFAMGESSTPLSNLLLEEMTARYDLPLLAPLSKWGTLRRAYPEMVCGLKRGFTFYHHPFDRFRDPHRENELLVAASPVDEIADTHWYRADFDSLFLKQAVAAGVTYVDETTLNRVSCGAGKSRIEGTRHNQQIQFDACFIVDATGPRGFLHRALTLSEAPLPGFPPTQALYTHFSGVHRANLSVAIPPQELPYDPDDAAVHHIFDGGWIWVLRFRNGMTSAGVAAREDVAENLNLAEGSAAWDRLLQRLPAVRAQFKDAVAEREWTHLRRLSFRSGTICSNNWVLLPSAAGFVDPLLSTGFPMTLLGVSRLAEIIEQDWNTERFVHKLHGYALQTDDELLATARLIASLYANMGDFRLFVTLTLLYFAAASYSETMRRLGRTQAASSFLLHDDSQFGPLLRQLCERAMDCDGVDKSRALQEEILRAIEHKNIGRFGDPARGNWYPVDARDLFDAGDKISATQAELIALLRRSGFAFSPDSC